MSLFASASALAEAPSAASGPSEIVVEPLPALGAGVGRLRSEDAVRLKGDALARAGETSVLDAVERGAPGAFVADVSGSGENRSLDYRGFQASPTSGAPQGLAVAFAGVRLNEPFGDTVNWDLVPDLALKSATVLASDPAFGANALGGAVVLEPNRAGEAAGGHARLSLGAFNRRSAALDLAGDAGGLAGYLAVEGEMDDGWRLRSPSRLLRAFADLRLTTGTVETHVSLAAAAARLGAVGPTPVDLLTLDRRSVFTSPQTGRDQDVLLIVVSAYRPSPHLSMTTQLAARAFKQNRTDGNLGAFAPCPDAAANLCLDPGAAPPGAPSAGLAVVTGAGAVVPCPAAGCDAIAYGTLDVTQIRTTSLLLGGQLAADGALLGRPQTLALGLAADASRFSYGARSILAEVEADYTVNADAPFPDAGRPISTISGLGYGPIQLTGSRVNLGGYAIEAVDLGGGVLARVSARLDSVALSTRDAAGTSPTLNGRNRFTWLNPAWDLVWRPGPAFEAFFKWAQTRRAPTPLELACANPARPCLLAESLVSDPPLKAPEARLTEVGVRWRFDSAPLKLRLGATAFDSRTQNDILPFASELSGRTYYANAPATRRSGVELVADADLGAASLRMSYLDLDPVYDFAGLIGAPNSPAADAAGAVPVHKGDLIGGVPRQRLSAGLTLAPVAAVRLSADVLAVGPQRLQGDASGALPKTPGYGILNLSARLRLPARAAVEIRLLNALDHRYATYGTLYNPSDAAAPGGPLTPASDIRSLTPAPPRTIRAQIEWTW